MFRWRLLNCSMRVFSIWTRSAHVRLGFRAHKQWRTVCMSVMFWACGVSDLVQQIELAAADQRLTTLLLRRSSSLHPGNESGITPKASGAAPRLGTSSINASTLRKHATESGRFGILQPYSVLKSLSKSGLQDVVYGHGEGDRVWIASLARCLVCLAVVSARYLPTVCAFNWVTFPPQIIMACKTWIKSDKNSQSLRQLLRRPSSHANASFQQRLCYEIDTVLSLVM